MRIGILGTGLVGQSHAARLLQAGHEVMMGTRDPFKTLNTVTAPLQVDPGRLAGGRHHAFLSDNDPQAKPKVARLLRDVYGWQHLVDLGDITTARGVEMMLPIRVQLFGLVGYEERQQPKPGY